MTGRRLRAWLLAPPALAAALAGCGHTTTQKTPDLAALPLVKGANIVTQVRECDAGVNSYCALEIVIIDNRFKSSTDLVRSELRHLAQSGWYYTNGDTGEQHAAESPGHKFRVTYATALGDLKGIDLGWIKRSPKITFALSRALFNRVSAMSIMLEAGSV